MTVVVGLTGGIGTGKSTVARWLAELGAVVIDADAIVHELQAPGTELLAEMTRAFGPDILQADGSLDREGLGKIVFADPEALRRLNALVHPRVGAEMFRRLAEAREAGVPLVVLDIPLLLEGRARADGDGRPRTAADLVEEVIVVWAPAETQLARVVARDGASEEHARERMAAQLPIDEKRGLADHVIENDGELDATRQQVVALYARLSSREESSARR
jgi:dephospho-CoA kinase